MSTTTTQIKQARARRVARERSTNPQLMFVEVTHGDGFIEVLTVDEYNRLTTTDTAHRGLRMISASEAAKAPRRRINT